MGVSTVRLTTARVTRARAASHHNDLTAQSRPDAQGRGAGCPGAKQSPAPSLGASLWGLCSPLPAKVPWALTFEHDGLPVALPLLLSEELVAGRGTGHEHPEFLREDIQRDSVSREEGAREQKGVPGASEPCLPVVSGLPMLRGKGCLAGLSLVRGSIFYPSCCRHSPTSAMPQRQSLESKMAWTGRKCVSEWPRGQAICTTFPGYEVATILSL